MKVLFLGRKLYSCKALEYLIEKNCEIVAVVDTLKANEQCWQTSLCNCANHYKLNVLSETELYQIISNEKKPELNISFDNIDLVISYLFPKRIKKPLIDLPTIGCINFHPAPLPELRGLGGYNFAIYNKMNYFGVSAHFVNEEFDSGDIIEVVKFDIDHENETAFSLEQKSQELMLKLFKKTIDTALSNIPLPRSKQGNGKYISKKDFETLRMVQEEDTTEEINRKIRAFWYPPHQGAAIIIQGQEYTLVNDQILNEIGKLYHEQ